MMIKKWIESQASSILIKIYSFFNKKAYILETSNYLKNKNKKMMINLISGKNEEYIPHIVEKIEQQINILSIPDLEEEDVKSLKAFLELMNGIGIEELNEYYSNLKKEENINNGKIKIEKDKKEMYLDEKISDQIYLIKRSPLFIKYLSKKYLLKKIFKDIINILSHNFCWVCYFSMILNHMLNASFISLVYPLSIFCYALLENPRPSKYYWNICYYFTFFSLIMKILCQEIYLGNFFDLKNSNNIIPIYEKLENFLNDNQLGIKLYDNYNDYFLNLSFDFLVLIVLIINKNILIINGLWEHNEEYYEDIEKANERVYKKEKKDIKNNLLEKEVKNEVKNEDKKKGYCERYFPKLRNEKPGKDFYYLYTLAMVLIILYSLLFYTTMVRDKIHDKVNMKINQFSGMTVIVVLFHIIILIVDRVIYLWQNRLKVKFKYQYFSEEKNEEVIEEDEKLKEINGIIYQTEEKNVPLLLKFILHWFLTLLSHAFIFFYIPMSGNYNIYNTTHCLKNISAAECNDFQKNKATIFFYIFYVFYLIYSAMQVKYGFYDIRRKSIFKNIESLNGFVFYAYKLIPFYYPIKNVIDWTLIPTSFNIIDWIKFENAYDTIFMAYIIKHGSDKKPVGKRTSILIKILLGGLVSIILILIIIFPLFAFSSLNPTAKINNVNSAIMKIYMSFIDNNEQERNILIFENNWAKSISNMSNVVNEVWDKYGYSDSYYTKTFPKEQIQIISFYADPENILSEFKINHILSSIASLLDITNSQLKSGKERIIKCNLIIENDFIRANPSDARVVNKQSELSICDINTNENSEGCLGLKNLYNKFNKSSLDNNTDIMFNITGFSPIIKLGSETKPIEVGLENIILRNLTFKTKGKDLFEIYFEKIKEDNGIQYHVMNEKVSEITFGYNFIGFYTAIVLVIGSYIGKIFKLNTSEIPLSEMPHPEDLVYICEGIKIARHLQDFKNEEYYFNVLIEILRTPDLVKRLSKSTLEQFYKRKKILEF